MATKNGGSDNSSSGDEEWSPNFNTASSGGEEMLDRVPSVRMRRKVRKKKRRRGDRTTRETTTEMEEMSIEVEVGREKNEFN